MSSFKALCRNLVRASVFNEVSHPIPGTAPNYVLLNDFRYRKIWDWYCKLLKREDEEDRFWDWQSRTWADIVRILVNAALVSHMQAPPNGHRMLIEDIFQASLHIRREQLLGCRTKPGTEPGPFVLKKQKNGSFLPETVLEVVHPEVASHNATVKFFGVTGAHLYLVLQPLGSIKSLKKVLLVWAVNTAGSKDPPDFENIAISARRGLETLKAVLNSSRLEFQVELRGLVLCSSLKVEDPELYFPEDDRLILIRVPAEPTRWLATVEWVVMALDEIIGGLL